MISSPYSGPIRKFPTGHIPTSKHKLLAIHPHRVLHAPPPQFAMIPKKLDMWFNDRFGICVTAQEAFAKACYSPEIFIDPNVVLAWATRHGYRDGANLTDVMDTMQRDGFTEGSQVYDDGPYSGVDYSNATVLQSALSSGAAGNPVNIGIMSSALPSGAGNQMGWYAVGAGPRGPEDHCVGLSAFGTAEYLYAQLKAVYPDTITPTGLNPSQPGFLLFTWSTMGFVDLAWIKAACGEAFVRNPTTIGIPPLPGPTPPPPPITTEGLTLAAALSAGSWPVGPGVYTNPTQIPPGFYPLTRTQPSPILDDEKAARAALEKLIMDVPATAQNDIQAARTALEKLIADFPAAH